MKQYPSPQNPTQLFRSLDIIFFALLFGQIAFFILVFYLKLSPSQIVITSFSFPFSIIAPSLSAICIIASRVVYKQLIKKSYSKTNIQEKLTIYQSAIILRLALIEGPSLFTMVVYLLTGEIYFLLLTLVLILIFITLKPSKEKAVIDLEINPDVINKDTFNV